jgi:hypothetical protein
MSTNVESESLTFDEMMNFIEQRYISIGWDNQ